MDKIVTFRAQEELVDRLDEICALEQRTRGDMLRWLVRKEWERRGLMQLTVSGKTLASIFEDGKQAEEVVNKL